MEEKLKEKGFLMCTIAISNNVIANYEIDDRVKSRIGTSEVFFEPYSRHRRHGDIEGQSFKCLFTASRFQWY